MTEHFGLILDGLIVVMLAATIFYASALSRRLNQLRDNRREMETAVRRFAEASIKADASVKGLKRTADESGTNLQKLIDRSQALRDELSFLVEAAEAVADRLETGSGTTRPRPRQQQSRSDAIGPNAVAADAERDGDDAQPLSAARPEPTGRRRSAKDTADQDLLRAIENLR